MKIFGDIISKLGIEKILDLKLMDQSTKDWIKVFFELDYQPIFYSKHYIEYQKQYFKEKNDIFENLSIIFYHNKKPISIWPLSISINYKDNLSKLHSFDRSLLKPIFSSNINSKIKKKINFIVILIKKKILTKPVFCENFSSEKSTTILHKNLLENINNYNAEIIFCEGL